MPIFSSLYLVILTLWCFFSLVVRVAGSASSYLIITRVILFEMFNRGETFVVGGAR